MIDNRWSFVSLGRFSRIFKLSRGSESRVREVHVLMREESSRRAQRRGWWISSEERRGVSL